MTDSTALATREQDQFRKALVSQYERDKMVRAMAAQIAGESWGKALSPHTQAAVARYAMEAGLDPVRHIDVLAGRVYINAQAYMDRLAGDAEFEGVEYVNITDDADQRRRWGVPAFALAAYIVLVRHRGRTFEEIGYAPKKEGKNAQGRWKDDVGMQFPHEKARTSGIRRAAKLAVPMWTQRMEEQFVAVEGLIQEQREHDRRGAEPAVVEPVEEPAMLAAGEPEDGEEWPANIHDEPGGDDA